jgi:hypothetical protein
VPSFEEAGVSLDGADASTLIYPKLTAGDLLEPSH